MKLVLLARGALSGRPGGPRLNLDEQGEMEMRMRGTLLGLVALLVSAVTLLPACKSTKSSKQPAGPQQPAGQPEQPAAQPDQPGGQPDQPGQAGNGQGQPDGVEMSEEEKRALADVKAAAAKMQELVESANTKLAATPPQARAALDDLDVARAEYEGVKSMLRPEVASRYVPELGQTYDQVVSLSGTAQARLDAERGDQGGVRDVVAREQQVRVEQLTNEVNTNFENGKNFLAEKRYEEAERSFTKVLEDLKWAPFEIDGAKNLASEAEQLLAQVRRERQAATIADQERIRIQIQEAEDKRVRDAQEKLRSQIQLLYSQAVFAFKQQDFAKAEQLASEILKLNPGDKIAKRLHEDAIESRHEKARTDFVREKIERWRRFDNEMLETRTPYAELLTYPDANYWRKVSRREAAGDASAFRLEEPDDIKLIKGKMREKPISFDFSDTPFDDVVQFIQQVGGINIVIDQDARSKLQEGDGNVTFSVKDLRIESALNLLLEFKGLSYTFKEGVLFITTPDSAANRGNSVPRIHDIRDLTYKINDFKGPDIRLGAGSSTGSGVVFDTAESDDEEPLTKDSLIELLTTNVAPSSWEQEGNAMGSIGGQLLVVNTPEVHAQINNFLNDLRQFAGLMVHVETRFIEVTDDFLQKIGVDWRGLGRPPADATTLVDKGPLAAMPFVRAVTGTNAASYVDNTGSASFAGGAYPGTQGTQAQAFAGFYSENRIFGALGETRARIQHFSRALGANVPFSARLTEQGGFALQYMNLQGEQWQFILTAVRKSTQASVVSSPRVTVFNTQRSYVAVLNQYAYIKDYDVEIAAQVVAADPEIGTVQDGLVLDVRPTVSHDRRYVTLELRPTVSFLVTPIPERNIGLGGTSGRLVNIQLPTVTLHSAETTARVPDQGAVIIGGLKTILVEDLRSEVPILGKIPILSFFFTSKGKADENRSLVIVARATIIDLSEEEERQRGRDVENQ